MSGPCTRCDGDGWVEVFGDEGFPVGARSCEVCGGSGRVERKVTMDDVWDAFDHGWDD